MTRDPLSPSRLSGGHGICGSERLPCTLHGEFLQVRRLDPVVRSDRFLSFRFVSELEYYGFSLSAGSLGGDTFINSLTLGAVEFPAYLLSMYLLKRFGRRNPIIFIMILGAAASLSAIATLGDDATVTIVRIILAMIGKFAVTASLGILYVYSGEIFPTVSFTFLPYLFGDVTVFF